MLPKKINKTLKREKQNYKSKIRRKFLLKDYIITLNKFKKYLKNKAFVNEKDFLFFINDKYNKLVSKIDKLSKVNIFHKKKSSRHKSKLYHNLINL